MARGDRERWDAKHEAAWNRPLDPPDDFVLRSLARLPDPRGANALDLACGAGRHALDLARRGYLVEAWDVSPIALELVRKRATQKGLMVATRELDLSPDAASGAEPGVTPDVSTGATNGAASGTVTNPALGVSFEPRAANRAASRAPSPFAFRRKPFSLVICVDFLDRALFVEFAKLVAPGGHLIFTTFTLDRAGDQPSARWCLERAELARGFAGFETLATHEASGRAGLFARRTSE
ncbi:MAG: methyltransferase domain-containing protein [Planctomycetes bacterium]|nr:methyltransferase domain-containing protein [Planctomycetota bacterium]